MQGSVIYQDILQRGLQQGRQEGRREGEETLIMRQLTRRFGELNPTITEQIRGLSLLALEDLAEALFDFIEVTDLGSWLQQQQRREVEIALITRQLNRRLGEVDPALLEQVQKLSINQLESLGEALLDFSEVENLVTWLEQQEGSPQ